MNHGQFNREQLSKRIKSLVLVLLLVLPIIFVFSSCKEETQLSKYEITAEYNADKKQVTGSVTVKYVNTSQSELGEIMFHLYPRAFREDAKFSPIHTADRVDAYPEGVSYGDMAILKVVRDGEESDIAIVGEDEDILSVDGALLPAASTSITIDFLIDLPTVRHRFGFCDDILNLGNWYPIACVIRDGKFDTTPYYANGDPFNSDVADYSLTLTVPERYKVATSGRQTSKTEGGKRIVTANLENARDMAAVVGKFNVSTKTENGTEINYYYIEDKTPALHLAAARDALSTFGGLFGEYAYDSLSVVKTPFLYGGMEYPALVYITDDDRVSESMFSEIIIHEVAHQWWYAAVGSDQVREAWLDEGLAEYSTTLFYEFTPSYGVEKDARMADALGGYVLYCEMYKNNGRDDTSMNRTVAQYGTSLEYSYMTYVKGALMLDALRDSIGDSSFFEGLKLYYNDYKFKRAAADDFIGAMEKASGVSLKGFFDSWLGGKVKLFAS